MHVSPLAECRALPLDTHVKPATRDAACSLQREWSAGAGLLQRRCVLWGRGACSLAASWGAPRAPRAERALPGRGGDLCGWRKGGTFESTG